jgi:hypothetical protein
MGTEKERRKKRKREGEERKREKGRRKEGSKKGRKERRRKKEKNQVISFHFLNGKKISFE